MDATGNIYVADRNNHRIQVFDSQGNFLLKFGSYGYGDGQFGGPGGVALDASGNIIVSEYRAVSTISRQPDSAIYCSDSTVRMSAVD